MCGIAGLWCRNGSKVRAAGLEPALNRMRHRGPDDEGYLVVDSAARRATSLRGDDSAGDLALGHWRDPEAPDGDLILGHRRLSILDLTSHGHQPMTANDARIWIVFNGEIYNYVELREELRQAGGGFHSGTDTEVILRAWTAWGPEMLHRFNGDWAFALLDLREGREPELFLARDRWGVKPLFYADSPAGFWFASEAKALVGHAVPFLPRESVVLHFLAWGQMQNADGSETFFEGISTLPPGCAMRVSARGAEVSRWYDLRAASEEEPAAAADDLAAELAEHVTRSVEWRLRADVPVGCCLSGGVDSTSVLGTISHLRASARDGVRGGVPTFSAIYGELGRFNEEEGIRRVVEFNDARPSFTYPDDGRLEAEFDAFVWHQDEPVPVPNFFAQWSVLNLVHEHGIKVVLNGQGADEIFGGYQPSSYQGRFLEWLGSGRWVTLLREQRARMQVTGFSWRGALREWVAVLRHGPHFVPRRHQSPSRTAEYFRSQALNAECCARLAANPQRIREKLRSEQDKLRKLRKRLQRKYDAAIESRIGAKRAQITKLREELARLVLTRANLLRALWSRVRGWPPTSLRSLLVSQTLVTWLPHVLRFEDRNSMAVSVEVRLPFLDHELVEWSFRRGHSHKIHRGYTKWILRKSMEGRVPDKVLWRPDKVGFETPERTLSKQLLATRKDALLSSPFLLRYLDPAIAKDLCDRVATGAADRDEARLVWRWLALDTWHRVYQRAAPLEDPAAPIRG